MLAPLAGASICQSRPSSISGLARHAVLGTRVSGPRGSPSALYILARRHRRRHTSYRTLYGVPGVALPLRRAESLCSDEEQHIPGGCPRLRVTSKPPLDCVRRRLAREVRVSLHRGDRNIHTK